MTERRPRAGSRRLASVMVLVVACAALLATSQPPDSFTLTTSRSVSAHLTAVAPRASGTLMLNLSAEALPLPTASIRSVSSVIRFEQPLDQSATVVLSVRTANLEIAARVENGATLLDIAQLCRAAEPCSRELELTLDWLSPTPGTSLDAQAVVTVEVVYNGVTENPAGASVGLVEGSAMAPVLPGPEIRAQTPEEPLVLDVDHWAAARHVVLSSSATARRGGVFAYLDRAIGQGAETEVLVSIIPDERPGRPLLATEPFEPFATCPRREACSRGFTVRFELDATEAGTVAPIEWSMGVRASFPDADTVPDGAEVGAEVDRVADATTSAPLLEASASGTLSGAEPEGDEEFVRQGVTLAIRAGSASLPSGVFEGLAPPARVILTVRGAVDARVEVAVAVGDVSESSADGTLTAEVPELQIVLNPFRGCGVGFACNRTISVRAVTARPDGAEPVPLTWDIATAIAYPGLSSVPDLATLDLTQVAGGL